MGAVVMAVLLAVLLDPANPLTHNPQDFTTSQPALTLNMKFDPRKMELSWDCKENVTNVACSMIHKEKGPITKKPKEKTCQCTFSPLPLQDGVGFMVEININQRPFVEKLFYENSGEEGTAAGNFSCFIYNAHLMNCTWVRGPMAPSDIQYYFYILDLRGQETECPRYVKDSGTHVGCHMDHLPKLSFYNYFLVNGTSQEMGIQFSDLFVSLQQIERISPPANISVTCNRSHCLITWERPKTYRRLSREDLQFQLVIQQQGSPCCGESEPISIHGNFENKYNFPSYDPRAKYTLKMRSKDSRMPNWGDWSDPIEFGTEERESSSTYIYILVVLGTLVFSLAIGCLLKRFLVMQSLFPPIPQIKNKLNDNYQTSQQATWEELASCTGKGGNEEILTVQEVA
ncbi:granulocyte-macrophage colony-stimulating factor receptor subunit alpha isoform X2 [Tamandua tetradactyla]|uniref:granulocyte-macrophage colony-stimulating factor receptor subunit alpha isoform X2 n=1 Tax=Tamandua tetradactyla TaxID=48850 RepID=UPI0040546523